MKKYWEEYYKNLQPTSFAKFCLKYVPNNACILDVGCGNGRDSYFFREKAFSIDGIDYAYKPIPAYKISFYQDNLQHFIKHNLSYDVVYSRFFLHSISKKEIIDLIKWSKGLFMAEFRVSGDNPKLFKNHKRTPLTKKWVEGVLKEKGFNIIYSKQSINFAPYMNEKPLVARIIAKKDVSIRQK